MAEDRDEISERVHLQIERARLAKSLELSLSHPDLREIPDEVFELAHLEVLTLRNTGIRVVPERIRELRKLKRLDLTANPVEQVPDIPGLVLGWNSYLRCRPTLSLQNISGIWVTPEKDGYVYIDAELVSELTRMP